jgi:sulfur-oxidizing protein SoxB
MFERGGVKVAVIGQAFPYCRSPTRAGCSPTGPSASARSIRKNVEEARDEGAEVVVLLSHNGFDVDRKLASRVTASTSS